MYNDVVGRAAVNIVPVMQAEQLLTLYLLCKQYNC